MNRRLKSFVTLFLSAITVGFAGRAGHAQNAEYDAGAPTTAVTVPVERGFINLVDGNLHLEIPFTSYKGRGALSTNVRMVHDIMIWHGVAGQWQPTPRPAKTCQVKNVTY